MALLLKEHSQYPCKGGLIVHCSINDMRVGFELENTSHANEINVYQDTINNIIYIDSILHESGIGCLYRYRLSSSTLVSDGITFTSEHYTWFYHPEERIKEFIESGENFIANKKGNPLTDHVFFPRVSD